MSQGDTGWARVRAEPGSLGRADRRHHRLAGRSALAELAADFLERIRQLSEPGFRHRVAGDAVLRWNRRLAVGRAEQVVPEREQHRIVAVLHPLIGRMMLAMESRA